MGRSIAAKKKDIVIPPNPDAGVDRRLWLFMQSAKVFHASRALYDGLCIY